MNEGVKKQDIPVFEVSDSKVLYYGTPINGADSSSFRHIFGNWSVDKKYVYFGSRRTPIELETFEPLNVVFARDRNRAYNQQFPLKDTSAESFRVFDSGVYFRGSASFLGNFIYRGFAGDAHTVWSLNDDGLYRVRSADVSSFRSYGGHFARDKNHAYFGRTRIKKAHLPTWRPWRDNLSIDHANVYYRSKLVPDVDRDSVNLLILEDSFSDRNGIFNIGQKITSELYLECLEYHQKAVDRERNGLADGKYFEWLREKSWRSDF